MLFEVKIDDKCSNEAFYHDPEYNEMNFGDIFAIDNKCFCIAQTDKVKIESLRTYLETIEGFCERVFSDI